MRWWHAGGKYPAGYVMTHHHEVLEDLLRQPRALRKQIPEVHRGFAALSGAGRIRSGGLSIPASRKRDASLIWSYGGFMTGEPLDPSLLVVAYPADEFPLSSAVAVMLAVDDLTTSHEVFAVPPERFVRATDQSTVLHQRFYDAVSKGFPLYEAFARWVLASLAENEPVYLQRIPNLRLQLPDNTAVGEFHRDSDYGHPDGELNVWVPLTSCERTSTIWVAPDKDSESARPWILHVGEALRFDGRNLLHGNVPNTTGATRVSLDFRYLPCRKLEAPLLRTVNTGMRFSPGDYYFSDPIMPS